MTSMVTNLDELLDTARSLPAEKCQQLIEYANLLVQQAANDQRPHEDIAKVIASWKGGSRSKEDIDQQIAEERDWGDR